MFYAHFYEWNYIVTSDKGFFEILRNYEIEQISETNFAIAGERKLDLPPYQRDKAILRDFAIEWQTKSADFNYSWMEEAMWDGFFLKYGTRYGLMQEFKENGIW